MLRIALAVLLVYPSIASATIIDFDDPALTSGMEVGDFYGDLGVTFVDAKIYAGTAAVAGIDPSHYSGLNVVSHSASLAPQPNDPIEAIFATPISSLTLTGLGVGWAGFLLNGYDSSGNLIATVAEGGSGGPAGGGAFTWFSLSLSAAEMTRITFSQMKLYGPDGSVAWDNLTFEPQSTVPEPATIALWLPGLAMLLRRRKRVNG
jgi:hypothetical protein